MKRAGESAARLIRSRFAGDLEDGATVFCGPGNNGGDGWIVANALGRDGVRVAVIETGEPRSTEARAARESAMANPRVSTAASTERSGIVIDALLGTGAAGSPRGPVIDAVDTIRERSNRGVPVISLDMPTGVDATTGGYEWAVRADFTVSFGTLKRGHLLAREACGQTVVVDIGLGDSGTMATLPILVDERMVLRFVPPIGWNAHKGARKTLGIVGGARGMAGAAILAGEGALRSGIGLLRIIVEPGNEVAIHAGLPMAIVDQWPETPDEIARLLGRVDALAIGPGMGNTARTRDLVERLLLAWNGPVVLDADALNVFAGDLLSLSQLLRGRLAVITPHPAEFSRLSGIETPEVVGARFEIGLEMAAETGANVLLKGSPTVVFSPEGARFVSAAGSAALATGGSGDVLAGMIGTLLAQMEGLSPPASAAALAACAAWVHGRAAELCGSVRGVTLADILSSMPAAWNFGIPSYETGILGQLDAVPGMPGQSP